MKLVCPAMVVPSGRRSVNVPASITSGADDVFRTKKLTYADFCATPIRDGVTCTVGPRTGAAWKCQVRFIAAQPDAPRTAIASAATANWTHVRITVRSEFGRRRGERIVATLVLVTPVVPGRGEESMLNSRVLEVTIGMVVCFACVSLLAS